MTGKVVTRSLQWLGKKIATDERTQKVGTSLKELLAQYRTNQRRIKLINKALKSQSRSSLSANTKRSLRRGYKAKPGAGQDFMEAFEGSTGIRKNQSDIIKRLRKMGHKTPSRAFKASR